MRAYQAGEPHNGGEDKDQYKGDWGMLDVQVQLLELFAERSQLGAEGLKEGSHLRVKSTRSTERAG